MIARKKYDVIVVLAGGITDDNQLPQSVKDRIHLAKVLFEKRWSDTILMSGKWSMYREYAKKPTTTEAQAMVEYAQALNLPKSNLLKEEHSHNTVENLQLVNRLFLQPNQWQRMLLVTSDFHLPRVKWIVEKYWHPSYQIRYLGVRTPASMSQWLEWRIGEILSLYKEWFLQHFQQSW